MLLRFNSIIPHDILIFSSQKQQQSLSNSSISPSLTLKNNEDGVTHLADLVDLIIRARRLSAAIEGNNTMTSPMTTGTTTTVIKINDKRINMPEIDRRNTIQGVSIHKQQQEQLKKTRRASRASSSSSTSSTSVLSILNEEERQQYPDVNVVENKQTSKDNKKGKKAIPTMIITASDNEQQKRSSFSSSRCYSNNNKNGSYFSHGDHSVRSSTTGSTSSSANEDNATIITTKKKGSYYYDEKATQSLPDVHYPYQEEQRRKSSFNNRKLSFRSDRSTDPYFERNTSTNSVDPRLRLMGPISPTVDGMLGTNEQRRTYTTLSSSSSSTSSGRPLTPPPSTGSSYSTKGNGLIIARDSDDNSRSFFTKKLMSSTGSLTGKLQEGLHRKTAVVKKLKNAVKRTSYSIRT
ncbi:hypothetical protein BDC45DRAFT_532036 [Circinella umbellata]|nr:hypothetical protein BDC45DRAFT_532036 [Circinella umbellata]